MYTHVNMHTKLETFACIQFIKSFPIKTIRWQHNNAEGSTVDFCFLFFFLSASGRQKSSMIPLLKVKKERDDSLKMGVLENNSSSPQMEPAIVV